MVYESDFYTTRRPYSRPLVSSYSVTVRPIILPLSSVIQLRSIPHMPYIAHKRLVTIVHSPVHHVYYAGAMVPIRVRAYVRPSILAAEFNRIRDLPRPSSRSYINEYLNSRDNIFFDDEAREIRARVDSLLRRVHVFVPRAVASDFEEEIVPERMRSHDYVRRLLSGRNNAKKGIENLSWYEVPERGSFGTLACVKYVAGKAQSIRKPYFKVADLRPADIRNDVNFLSYYSKNRQAAATASNGQLPTEREMRKARALGNIYTSQEEKKTANESIPELEQKAKTDKKLKKEAELEEQSQSIYEPNVKLIEESTSMAELAKESETISEPLTVKSLKSIKAPKFTKSIISATSELKIEPALEVEPLKEPNSVNEIEPKKEVETVPKPEAIVGTPEGTSKLDIPAESSQNNVSNESIEAVSDEAKEEETEKVRQEKEDAIRKAEEYLAKVAREALTEDERRKAVETERLQLEMEEKKAWEALQLAQERKAELCEILENERQEVERKAEETKLEAERAEKEKVAEEERIINQTKLTSLIQEQERLIIEEHLEEVQQQKQEQEERLAEITLLPVSEPKDVNCTEDVAITEETTDQEKEEKPYDVTTDDDTRIKEDNAVEEQYLELIKKSSFVEESEGVDGNKQTESIAIENDAQIEDNISGGEFEWGDQDT